MNPQEDIKVILYSNRAQCYLNLKDFQSAERDASSALMLDREHIKALFRLGTAQYRLKKYKEAKSTFNNLVMIDPKNVNGLEYLGHTEQKLSKIRLEAYEKLCSGEITGDSTKIGTNIIKVQEFNLDQRFAEKMKNGDDSDLQNSGVKETSIPSMVEEIQEEPKEVVERESKIEFLSRTTIDDSKVDTSEQKGLSDFVESANEEEELKRLQQERNKPKKKNKKGKKNKNKKKEGLIDVSRLFVDSNTQIITDSMRPNFCYDCDYETFHNKYCFSIQKSLMMKLKIHQNQAKFNLSQTIS